MKVPHPRPSGLWWFCTSCKSSNNISVREPRRGGVRCKTCEFIEPDKDRLIGYPAGSIKVNPVRAMALWGHEWAAVVRMAEMKAKLEAND